MSESNMSDWERDNSERDFDKVMAGDDDIGTRILQFPTSINMEERTALVKKALEEKRNPFLVAARDLLRVQADFARPQSIPQNGIEGLRDLLRQEVQAFTQVCDRLNLRRDHTLAVRYTLCTAIDENIQRQDWARGQEGGTGPWSQHLLLNTFHQSGDGGKTVFLLIGRMAAQPQEHIDVLEVMLHVLGLGFKGHYSGQPDGDRMLETIRHRLYTMVAAHRPQVSPELSPQWRGLGETHFKTLRSIPVWVTASLAGLILFGMFAWFKYDLMSRTDKLEKSIVEISKLKAPETKPLRLKELLAKEISAGKVQVIDAETQSSVIINGDDMFLPGSANINPNAQIILQETADGISGVSGKVTVTGYSDNQPIKTPEFPNNQVLSEKRAQSVAKVLQEKGVASTRINTVGKGDADPVASNDTAVGRAKNRRVVIVVSNQK